VRVEFWQYQMVVECPECSMMIDVYAVPEIVYCFYCGKSFEVNVEMKEME